MMNLLGNFFKWQSSETSSDVLPTNKDAVESSSGRKKTVSEKFYFANPARFYFSSIQSLVSNRPFESAAPRAIEVVEDRSEMLPS